MKEDILSHSLQYKKKTTENKKNRKTKKAKKRKKKIKRKIYSRGKKNNQKNA